VKNPVGGIEAEVCRVKDPLRGRIQEHAPRVHLIPDAGKLRDITLPGLVNIRDDPGDIGEILCPVWPGVQFRRPHPRGGDLIEEFVAFRCPGRADELEVAVMLTTGAEYRRQQDIAVADDAHLQYQIERALSDGRSFPYLVHHDLPRLRYVAEFGIYDNGE
jgi:hypothetical protein